MKTVFLPNQTGAVRDTWLCCNNIVIKKISKEIFYVTIINMFVFLPLKVTYSQEICEEVLLHFKVLETMLTSLNSISDEHLLEISC